MHEDQFTTTRPLSPTPRRFGMEAGLCRRELLAAVLGGVGLGGWRHLSGESTDVIDARWRMQMREAISPHGADRDNRDSQCQAQ